MAGNNFNKVTDGGRNMFGVKSLLATVKLDATKSASQAAHGAAIISQTAAKASGSAGGNVVKNAAQGSITDKIKNFFFPPESDLS